MKPAAAERPASAAQPVDEKPAAEKPTRKPRATRSKAAKKDEGDAAVSDSATPKADDAPQAAEEAPKPRRRGRKPKAVEEQVEQAPKPRRGRKPKAANKAEAAPEQAPSAEVAQARALAQISQASVVRRQRRMEERAAEMLASAGSPDSDAAPTQFDAASLIDPALRPHRRGRKPKAYIEAERAAAAALAAAKLASQGDAPARETQDQPAQAPLKEASAFEPVSADAEKASAESEKKSDNRPGRARRAASKAKLQADEAKDEKPVDAAPVEAPAAPEPSQGEDDAAKDEKPAALTEEQPQGRQSRRSHSTRARDRQQGEEGSEQRFDRPQRNDRNDRGDRNDRNGNDRADRNDKRNNKQNRKQRNNRFNGPVEPSVSREELAACKVAELREKAKELNIDYVGKKKAELVEEVYAATARAEGFRDIEGILDITNEGFGYIRAHGYMPSRDDAFVPANMIRAAGLRCGDVIAGTLRPSRANDKFPGLAKIRSINGRDPEEMRHRPKFADLTPIYPNEPLKMEHGKESITGRAIDIVAPVGKGQRGLIVSPPKAGKTTILKKICQSIATNNPEVHLICLLVDERPEEVTDMQRSIRGDVVASTFDMPADNHTRVSELVIERAKRIVEMGGDVVVVLDSITRLARAYNLAAPASGRILSGGVDSAALYPPKRFLGAARNIENGGSLTILASALVDTGSKMDEVIFEEFKGTGNMELKLDRDLADRRIFPAIDPVQSGTRNEDLLIDKNIQPFVWGIRRILANMNNTERAAASFIKGLKGTNSNEEFLIRSAKKAADHSDAM
nr:transcription termination factor Rho [Collinsella tanakaei]